MPAARVARPVAAAHDFGGHLAGHDVPVWMVSFQTDAPDTHDTLQRQQIRRLRDCACGAQRRRGKLNAAAVADTSTTNRLGQAALPEAIGERLADLFASAAYSTSYSALTAVRQRLDARQRPCPVEASAEGVAELLNVDLALHVGSLNATTARVVANLRAGPASICLRNLQRLFAEELQAARPLDDDLVHDDTVRAARRWVLRHFGGKRHVALVSARGAACLATGDVALRPGDWAAFLERAGWPRGEMVAEAVFAEADFRGAGLIPASELLFAEVAACRHWLEDHVGSSAEIASQLAAHLVFQTRRQRELEVVGKAQWLDFLGRVGWPAAWQGAAVVAFEALDILDVGEVRIPELLGIVELGKVHGA